jgi:hypothetical protein
MPGLWRPRIVHQTQATQSPRLSEPSRSPPRKTREGASVATHALLEEIHSRVPWVLSPIMCHVTLPMLTWDSVTPRSERSPWVNTADSMLRCEEIFLPRIIGSLKWETSQHCYCLLETALYRIIRWQLTWVFSSAVTFNVMGCPNTHFQPSFVFSQTGVLCKNFHHQVFLEYKFLQWPLSPWREDLTHGHLLPLPTWTCISPPLRYRCLLICNTHTHTHTHSAQGTRVTGFTFFLIFLKAALWSCWPAISGSLAFSKGN